MAITNNLGCFIFFIKQVGVYSPCTDSVQRPFPGFPFYKGWYICGKRHGWWEDYWSDGRPRYIGYYDMDIEVGYKTDVRDKIIDMVLE